MNKLQEQFGKRGLTIIGVTDEPAAKIESFIKEKGISYLIAIGGAAGYKTNGIPHAWLVDSNQEIVWEGHPGGLKESQIEEHLKTVRLVPTFELPKELKTAQTHLDKANYGSALKELQKHAEKPKTPDSGKAATEAIAKVNAYGKSKLEEVDAYAKEGFYGDAMETLNFIEKAFKGTEAGDKAKAKKDEWKKDKTIQAEIQGAALLKEAEALLKKRENAKAIAILRQIEGQKKFDGTNAQKQAKKRLIDASKS